MSRKKKPDYEAKAVITLNYERRRCLVRQNDHLVTVLMGSNAYMNHKKCYFLQFTGILQQIGVLLQREGA